MITILEAGMGNVGSIMNMLRRLDIPARTAATARDLSDATRLILPGVGAFDAAMTRLDPLRDVLNELVIERRVPVLGICLGMQVLGRGSEEGRYAGLGWIAADTVRFRFGLPEHRGLKIPHMRWNEVQPAPDAALFAGFAAQPRFYFVHSYHMVCDDSALVTGTVDHGGRVAAAVQHENIHGVQFHPEKSHRFGMTVLENFARLP